MQCTSFETNPTRLIMHTTNLKEIFTGTHAHWYTREVIMQIMKIIRNKCRREATTAATAKLIKKKQLKTFGVGSKADCLSFSLFSLSVFCVFPNDNCCLYTATNGGKVCVRVCVCVCVRLCLLYVHRSPFLHMYFL